jgi:uncharacterized membrane protein (UPF0127 family)
MKAVNQRNHVVLADKVKVASTFFKRLIGLLDRAYLNEGEGLVISPSNSIHMFFMRFAIDVLFLDKKGRVVAILRSFKPWKLSRIYFNACSVIELPPGVIDKTGTQPGDFIKISE